MTFKLQRTILSACMLSFLYALPSASSAEDITEDKIIDFRTSSYNCSINIANTNDCFEFRQQLTLLNNSAIIGDAKVKIILPPGVFKQITPLIINHPQSHKIEIMGDDTREAELTHIDFPSSGSNTVTLTVKDENIAVGNYIIPFNTGRIKSARLHGGWSVLTVNTVSGDSTKREITLEYNSRESGNIDWGGDFSPSNGKVVIIPTVLQFNGGVNGIKLTKGHLGKLKNIALEGNWTWGDSNTSNQGANGIITGDQSSPGNWNISVGPDVAISKFNSAGIYAKFGGTVLLEGTVATTNNGGNGVRAYYGGKVISDTGTLYTNANWLEGIFAKLNGGIALNRLYAFSNGKTGITTSLQSKLFLKGPQSFMSFNEEEGIYARASGSFYSNATPYQFGNNGCSATCASSTLEKAASVINQQFGVMNTNNLSNILTNTEWVVDSDTYFQTLHNDQSNLNGSTNQKICLKFPTISGSFTDCDVTFESSDPFPALKTHLDSLSLAPGSTATVYVNEGRYDISSAFVLDHPQGEQIYFEGVSNPMNSSTQPAEGNYILVYDSGYATTADEAKHQGIWEVVSFDSSGNLGYKNLRAGNDINLNDVENSGNSVEILHSILNFTGDTDGFVLGKLGGLSKLAISSTGTNPAAAIRVKSDANENYYKTAVIGPYVGTSNFNTGFQAENRGVLHINQSVAASNNTNGFVASDYGLINANVSSSGNYGFIVSSWNDTNGYLSKFDSFISASNGARSYYNGANGLVSTKNSSILFKDGEAMFNEYCGIQTMDTGSTQQGSGGSVQANKTSGIASSISTNCNNTTVGCANFKTINYGSISALSRNGVSQDTNTNGNSYNNSLTGNNSNQDAIIFSE